ncbi:hypothetical protein HMPREF1092_03304 [Clostridium thermobutyricum]|uniref:XkdX family protein n=1 Tax=Clostridium thermobutyricum TaxID=29372 RepID=N9XT40_9CLOT|nr:XkdX family protein [Clostridium thermobutyricum]ENY98746.1 hypothetical protein HMPREF1092_03304 [Clostridium thermobutyricum]
MNNDNFNFWKMVYDMKAIDINTLRKAVKTTSNPYGEISEEQFKEITGVDFEVKETTATPQTTPVTQPVTPVQPQQVTQ